jgi:poly(3-hydroxybutyrate) depolymerase
MAAPAQELSPSGSEVYNPNLYAAHDLGRSALRLVHGNVELSHYLANSMIDAAHTWGWHPPLAEETRRVLSATREMSKRSTGDYPKPEYGIDQVDINGETIGIKEVVVEDKPHSKLIKFERDTDRNDPSMLIMAPDSGHYATLLRDTALQLSRFGNVYMVDKKSAREVPVELGPYGLDDNISYQRDYIKLLGPNINVIAVCQATVPGLAAVAHLAETEPESQPATLTLMGGPLDTAAAPTAVTDFANRISIEWLERNLIGKVPNNYPGAGRLVYPGFVQLANFMSMNPGNHAKSQRQLYSYLIDGEHDTASKEAADKIKAFYDEYCAVTDLPAEFYLDTVQRVFKDRELPNGTMMYSGSRINPSSIDKTAMFTVEGAQDDISAPGQTLAAQEWFGGLSNDHQYHYLQEGVGHYGIFNGKKWAAEIAPRIAGFIQHEAAKMGLSYDAPASPVIMPSKYQP